MPKKRALLVAINDYGEAANNLSSCVNDAIAFERKLKSDFDFQETLSLVDANATARNLAAGLDWLIRGAEDGDQLVFFFSGHGAQAPEKSVMVESLVLRDGPVDGAELIAASRKLPPGVLTVVLDCCFSCGTQKLFVLTRGALVRQKWWLPDRDALSKHIEAWQTVTAYQPFACAPMEDSWPAAAHREAAGGSARRGHLEINGQLVTACSENEATAAGGPLWAHQSAFTFAFLAALSSLGSGARSRELLLEARHKLEMMGFRQTPMLKEPLAARNPQPRPFLSAQGSVGANQTAVDWDFYARLLEHLASTVRKQPPPIG